MGVALVALYVVAGLVLMGVSVPLIQRRVPPNGWYGFRVRRTLNNPSVWYPANEYSGRLLFWQGAGTVAVAVVLGIALRPDSDARVLAYTFICTAVLLVGVLVCLVLSLRYRRSLPD